MQLKCHFTWKLLVQDRDPDELEDRFYKQLPFFVTKNKYMVHNLLAYVMHLRGDHTKAIDHLKKAEEIIEENNPDGTDQKYLVTYGNYAWVFYYLNQYEDSQKYIDKVEQIYKDHKVKPEMAEIYGEKGWSLSQFSGHYYEEAKQCLEKVLELEPEDPVWITGYATVVYRLEGFSRKPCPVSLDLLKRAVQKNPNDAIVKALLALKFQDLKRTKEGMKYIDEAIEQAPNLPYLLRYVAKFYRRAGMVDKALHALKTAVDLMPNSGFHHHQIGLCYRQKYFISKKKFGNKKTHSRERDLEEMNDLIQNAIFHFEKTLELKKTLVYAHVDLANMYCAAKQYQKAEDTFKTVLEFSNLRDEEKLEVYYSYGRFKEFCRRSVPEALEYYKKCLQITVSKKERELAEKSLKRCYQKALIYGANNEEYVRELCELKLMI
ncbi:hypothetical protein GDO81_004495 [Engystomops pustulosus]|uniref:Interferon-induced protein with tetratricopeptide repeats 5 n=1 Tax=Engystomops pustulosus TaxID=76066 RepID=A0AAV6ZT37_ENGPU|nr:hypothetical protein GDO81_004495 [Engystomops pustulosus]